MSLKSLLLKVKISYMKFLLDNKAKGKSPLTSVDMVTYSQKLDKLIAEYQRTLYVTYKRAA